MVISLCALAVVLAPSVSAEPAAFDPTGNRSGGPAPTVNGVPCVGGNLGACLSFKQNRPPAANAGARSIVGHSPTVRR
jgi:hypothetical protein